MATILKQEQIQQSGDVNRLVAFNIDDVQQRAQAYLAQVREQAAGILAAAKSEADQQRASARAAGVAEAQKTITEQVEQRARQLTEERIRTATAACQQAV